MGSFNDANTAAILAAGRASEWTPQAAFTGRPSNVGAGGDMKASIVALVKISLRENVLFRTVRVTSPDFDAADSYTIDINGTVHLIVAPTDLDDLVTQWETAINGGSQTSNVTALAVNALDDADPGNNTIVRITGDNDLDYTIDISKSVGTGTIDAQADASSCVARLYGLDGPQTTLATNRPNRWDNVRWPKTGQIEQTIENRGYMDRFTISSIQRMYVQISDVFGAGDGIPGFGASVTYLPRVDWGPSIFIST